MDSLIVGLGNQGSSYVDTPHNVGFKFIDILLDSLGISLKKSKKHLCFLGSVNYDSFSLLLAKPTTFMNLSGDSVRSISKYYSVPHEKIFVVYDDLDLSVGKVKIKRGGGDAGHKGARSISSVAGDRWVKVRIGIDRPSSEFIPVSDYVTSKMSKDKIMHIDAVLKKIVANIDLLLAEEFDSLMNKIAI